MRASSPLRYPGGKASLTKTLKAIREQNSLGATEFAEAFAGGAGAALSLLFLEETTAIHLNDADAAIFSFWWSLKNRSRVFLNLVDKAVLDIDEWSRQREIYVSGKGDRLKKGFSAFYLNRCNRSGIIMNGGPIGGMEQKGEWKLDVRFNKANLHKRCAKVAEYRQRINVSCQDALDFIKSFDLTNTTLFIDPPYYEKGSLLYLNLLTPEYHASLAAILKDRQNAAWVLTYDDCPVIRKLYEKWARIYPFDLTYSAAVKRKGKEILITPRWMEVPEIFTTNVDFE